MSSQLNRMPSPVGLLLCVLVVAVVLASARASRWQGLLVTSADLQALIPGDNIPGFRAQPAIKGSEGPHVELDLPRENGTVISRIRGHWLSTDELNWVEIRLVVCESPEAALKAAESFIRLGSTPKIRMSANARIGDASWTWAPGSYGFTGFTLGRTYAWVNTGPRKRRVGLPSELFRISVVDGHHHEIADTLARGLEWSIRQRPELLAKGDSTERRTVVASGKQALGASALTFGNVIWAPLSAFEQAGAEVNWNAKTNRASVSYHGKNLELRPFHREASIGGVKVDLGATVLLGRNGPVVPVYKVAEALGIKAEETATTLRLG